MRKVTMTGVMLAGLLGAGGGAGAQDDLDLDNFYFTDVRPLTEPDEGERIDSPFSEWGPSVTKNGLLLYFTSIRDGVHRIFMASRDNTDQAFVDVQLVEELVDVLGGTVKISGNGLTLFSRTAGTDELALARRPKVWDGDDPEPFADIVMLDDLSSASSQRPGAMTVDERTLLFDGRNEADADRHHDLYEAWLRDDESYGVRAIDEINQLRYGEASPAISADGKVLLFGQEEFPVLPPATNADIWFAHRTTLFDAPESRSHFSAATRPRFLEEVNSDASNEMSPFLSYDWPDEGAKLYFVRCGSGCVGIDTAIYEATWRRRPVPLQSFRRADANADVALDIADPIFILGWLFLGATDPPCVEAADTNNDDAVDLTDAIFVLQHLFLGGPAPSAPRAFCGPEDPDDTLSCDSFPPCD